MDDTNIRNNIAKFYQPIPMPGGWMYDHIDLLKTINLYWASKYKTGPFDEQGFRKFFVTVGKPACELATKFIDLDAKDLTLLSTVLRDELRVWAMQKRLKSWLSEKGISHLLNQISVDYPKYGHVVIKKTKSGWKKVNIENIRCNLSIEKLSDGDFVYEVIPTLEADLDNLGIDPSKVEELKNRKLEDYFLYDCYERKGNKWKHEVKASLFCIKNGNGFKEGVENGINNKENYQSSITFSSEEIIKLPYRELKWESLPGRWLGYGFMEYLIEDQIATNEAENFERKGLAFTSLKIFQTRSDESGGINVLTDIKNGDIVSTPSEITPIANEERNLAAFNSTRNRWDSITKNKTYSFDSAKGENLPSRTPLGVANLQASMVASYYDFKRENYGLFLKDWILDDVIPDFVKDTEKEHNLVFSSSTGDVEEFDKAITQILLDKAIYDYANETGFFPSQNQRDEAKNNITNVLTKNKNRVLTIMKDAYKNAKFIVDVNVTGESIDVSALNSVITTALNILGSNPSILQNPQTRAFFLKFLSISGVSPVDVQALTEIQNTPQDNTMPVAGSIARPNVSQQGVVMADKSFNVK